MKAVKSKGTKIEQLLGSSMWKKGVRYRKNNKNIFGSPDFSIKKYKIAIFCDGEFWHGKDWSTRKYDHKSNKEFWYKKIEGNIQRDKVVNEHLTKDGWIVIRFWGKEIIKNSEKCVKIVIDKINERKRKIIT